MAPQLGLQVSRWPTGAWTDEQQGGRDFRSHDTQQHSLCCPPTPLAPSSALCPWLCLDTPPLWAPCRPHSPVEVPVDFLLRREAHHATDDAAVVAVPALVADLCPAVLVANLHDSLCHRQLPPPPGHHRPQPDLLHMALLSLRGSDQPRLTLYPITPPPASPSPGNLQGCRKGDPSRRWGTGTASPAFLHLMALGSQGASSRELSASCPFGSSGASPGSTTKKASAAFLHPQGELPACPTPGVLCGILDITSCPLWPAVSSPR